MANLVKLVNLFFLFFLITSLLFFFYQFSINLISLNAFTKVFLFFILSVAILLYSYKKSKKCFNFIIESIGVNQRIAAPIMMFVFLGGFSIALAITFISFIQALGLLFIVESIESLILNIIALVCFFWLAFILFIGWDFIKISGFASQYTMIVEKRSGFLENMRFFFSKLSSLRNAFLAFVIIDLACNRFPKSTRRYYKKLILPVKLWSVCHTLYDEKNITNSFEKSFFYFKTKPIKQFRISSLASIFLPILIVPVVFSLGTILTNIDYFAILNCFNGSCFFIVIYFLIFMSLGFFFSYSIILSLESAYYVKILNNIKENKTQDKIMQEEYRIKFIEEECYRKISKLKGNFWDIFRIYR